jgi:hypothetical protein
MESLLRGAVPLVPADDPVQAGTHGVIITTYDQVRSKLDALSQYRWHYLVLDEGHKIRNPDTATTLAVKVPQNPQQCYSLYHSDEVLTATAAKVPHNPQ